MKRTLVAVTAALALSGCSETLGGLALVGTAVTGFMTSGSANPDYTKYADTCKAIVTDIVTIRTSRHTVIKAALDNKSQFVQGGAMVMLAREDKDDAALLSRCFLQGPESFMQTLFKNTNVPNFLLALYQENRADARANRMMELQKVMGLANMEHQENMQSMENNLLTDLAGRPTDNFNAGAAAARPIIPATTTTGAE